ncbi:MAG: ABC transporter permease [Candidatus Margulisbacteria bacterium]|nr:ABC transporter permease [Candidatus Margulisiibacteriota bacterium]MBU1021861.1 ABC transporter permease [Candidatus Margulisiibacteriota bacterium]MBU1729020.1 ABC transporter permease [Candidatus Margulisiibacteriota bacterium]MBU1954427.1 ABC transporter permease [Candidatus Margulisiibacteriota bacterium]
MLFKLAFRNIFRHFTRTFLTFLAIALGLAMLIIVDSMLTGIDQESFDRIINYETGHIKIFDREYREDEENMPLDKSIDNPAALITKVGTDPDVVGVTSRINFRIMLSDGIDQYPAVGIAVNPADDESVFLLKQAVAKGEFLKGSEEAMLLGEGLAEDFGVDVGDYMTVLTRTKYDTYQAIDLRIKGILKTEDPKIDYAAVVIPLGLGQESLDMGKGVTEIDIKLKDPARIQEFRDMLAKDIPGMEVATWKDLAADVIAISQAKRGGTSFMLFSIFVIALIGISNTILLAAFERTREIGMMAAMGMKRGQIVRLFVLEGAMIGVLGSITGCLLGILINIPFVKYGINWGFVMRDVGDIGYRVTGVSHGVWNINMIVIAFVAGILISALTSIYPARVASKMEPTEALRKA